MIYSNHQKY